VGEVTKGCFSLLPVVEVRFLGANWLELSMLACLRARDRAQLAVDATLVCPVRRDGLPRDGADRRDGVALRAARRAKERTYHELLASRRCRLVVLAREVGGRWSAEAFDFVRLLARCRARSAPSFLRVAEQRSWQQQWRRREPSQRLFWSSR
jgi:hypothetical protein